MAQTYQPQVRTFTGFRSTEKPATETLPDYKRYTTAKGESVFAVSGFRSGIRLSGHVNFARNKVIHFYL